VAAGAGCADDFSYLQNIWDEQDGRENPLKKILSCQSWPSCCGLLQDIQVYPAISDGMPEIITFLKLLLNGIRIVYEPAAIGYGEAPLNWAHARAQRERWLRGTRDASQQFIKHLIFKGMKRRNLAMLDGALQAIFPSYSTLSILSLIVLVVHVQINYLIKPIFLWPHISAWAVVVGTLVIYPMIGLALERAPLKAYLVILSGPYYILWRTWLAFISRFGGRQITWIRTEHGQSQ